MLLNQPCAFIDIETTGTHANSEGITEIGVRMVDITGELISWQQLLNPGKSIPGFIQELTGISNKMVADQPYFDEVASELLELIDGAVFIAHNARFDYSFLKKAFQHCGYSFRPKVICTVKLSRALYPQFKHHNLETICQRINYKRNESHRALADVDAMLAFVQHTIAEHGIEKVNRAAESQLSRPSQPAYIDSSQIDKLPNGCGVYRFYDEEGALLYVGKSIHLRERVKSHFSADLTNSKEMALAQAVRHIEHKETYGELGALLLENQQIKTLQPIHNRRQRRYRKLWCYQLDKKDNYIVPRLTERANQEYKTKSSSSHLFSETCYGLYTSKSAAEKWYKNIIAENGLCKKILGLEKTTNSCFNYQIKRCEGACVGEENPREHNQKLLKAMKKNRILAWPFDEPVVIIEETENALDNNQMLCDYHLVDQWAHLGTVKEIADLPALLSSPNEIAFDRETYRFLNRYIHLARPISEVLVDQETNAEVV